MVQPGMQEEVTIVNSSSPQIIKKITKQVEPEEVYEEKKTIFRFSQIIWYVLGLVEALLIFRVTLKALGANPFVGFTNFIYTITNPLTLPFSGILGTSVIGSFAIEWSDIIAVIVYICIAWGLIYLLDLIYPISPKDVEQKSV